MNNGGLEATIAFRSTKRFLNLNLQDPVQLKFGILKSGNEWKANIIEHSNLISLSANVVELTRLTHRSDIATNWNRKNGSTAVISLAILTSNFLLFGSNLSSEEKARFYAKIIGELWKIETSSPISKLASLIIIAMSLEQFQRIYRNEIMELFLTVEIKNEDLAISLRILHLRHGLDFQSDDNEFSDVLRRNMSACGFWEGYFEYVCDFFDYFGWTNESWHYSKLRSGTIKFLNTTTEIKSEQDLGTGSRFCR